MHLMGHYFKSSINLRVAGCQLVHIRQPHKTSRFRESNLACGVLMNIIIVIILLIWPAKNPDSGFWIESNGVRVDCEGGNCQSRCLAYGATCSVCSKVYAGKGVNTLRDRVNGHRSCYYSLLSKAPEDIESLLDKCDDDQILGLHIYLEHNMRDRADFNTCYKFDVLKTCTPDRLRIIEQFYIESLNTLMPNGLNVINSISAS